MPKVATYQPDQVSTQIARGPRASVTPSGAPVIAQGLSSLAGAMQQQKAKMDNSLAEEAVVQFERQKNDLFFNPESGYFNTQGRDAFDRAEEMNEALEALKRSHSDKLTSPNARQAFDRVAAYHITRGQQDIARHSSKNLQAWEIATINSQVENTLENATLYWNDSERLGVQQALGRQAILDASSLEGAGSEVTQERLQTYESSFARSAISAAIQSSGAEGEQALDKWQDRLEGPDLLKMQSAVQKRKQAEKTQVDAQTAVLKAGNLVEVFGDEGNARTLIMEQINQIEDAELRSNVTKESMYQLGIKRQADSEARAATFESGENFIVNGGSVSQFRAQNPEAWEDLTATQKRTLNSGKTVATDYVFLSDVLTLPKEKLAEVNPTDHFDRLSSTDRSKLIGAVKSARAGTVDNQVGRTRTSQTTAAVEQLFGNKTTWDKGNLDRINSFYSVVDNEVSFREEQKGSPLTSDEYTNLLNGMTKKVVKEGFFNVGFAFGLGNSEVDLASIPADDLKVISEYLNDNNIPANADNIMKAYQQALK